MKETSWSEMKSNVFPGTGRLFPCHLPSWGLSLGSQVGWEPQLPQNRHSWQRCPTHGICRTCLQFVSIFRHICKCSLRNTSPQKIRAFALRFSKAVIVTAFLMQSAHNLISQQTREHSHTRWLTGPHARGSLCNWMVSEFSDSALMSYLCLWQVVLSSL